MVAVDTPAGVGLAVALGPTTGRRHADRGGPGRPASGSPRAQAKGAGIVWHAERRPLQVDDELWCSRPAPRSVRALQSHGTAHPAIGPGHRVAINLTGIGHRQVARGHALVRPGQWHRAHVLDASLRVLDGLGHAVTRRGAYLLYVGAGEHAVQLRVLGPDVIEPGGHGFVRLHLPVALPLSPGDRFVLRESGRQETVGGGEILDVDPVVRAADAVPDRSVDRVVAERGVIGADQLYRLTGERRPPQLGNLVVDPAVLDAWTAEVRAAVHDAGGRGLELAPLDEHHRLVAEQLATTGELVVDRRARAGAITDPLADHPYLAAL
jgi:selenocysteine-specific elongation factor